MTTNEMTLAKAFRDAGIEQAKAEALSSTIFDAIRDNVATKADLQRAEQALRSDLRDVEHRLTLRGLGALVTGFGLLFAALHYWPPHMTP
jgi:hypothetical protein